jgi:SAM-dependent methyltransferase
MRMVEINRSWYSRWPAVAASASEDTLEPALVLILLTYRDSILGQPILDIGVGAGRTTLYMSRLTSEYVGIDNSEAMVAYARARFPGIRLDVGDARDLGRFVDESFRLALFSRNGIDALDHEGRLRALEETARVLQPGGLFAFSSHNRNHANGRGRPRLAWKGNPLTLAADVADWMRDMRNHARVGRHEYDGADYAIVNDAAHHYALLHYCVSKEEQRRQLDQVGLTVVDMFDAWANPLAEHSDDAASPSVWYVARKQR